MKLIETGSFPIVEIDADKRLRAVDTEWVEGIAQTIAQSGLQHPIQVMKLGNEYKLISGAHRLAAFQLLGRNDIPAMIYEPETEQPELEIRYQEIVENIARRDLSALDRASHIAELKETYQKLYGETRGGDRKSKVQQLHFWSLGEEVAAKMGLSKRTIFADAEMWRALSPAVKDALRGTALANRRSQIYALSKENHTDQMALLHLILTQQAANVNAAADLHLNRISPSDDERNVIAFQKIYARCSAKARRQIRAIIDKDRT